MISNLSWKIDILVAVVIGILTLLMTLMFGKYVGISSGFLVYISYMALAVCKRSDFWGIAGSAILIGSISILTAIVSGLVVVRYILQI
jgi:hypothetical protein